jgi:hypothetical protein
MPWGDILGPATGIGGAAVVKRPNSTPEPTFVGQLRVNQASCQNRTDVLMNKRFLGTSLGVVPGRQTTCACHFDSMKGRRNEVGGCVLMPVL